MADNLNSREAIPHIDQNVVTLGLTVQTGPGGPECHRTMILFCVFERLPNLVD
jgi:hypothetical protein